MFTGLVQSVGVVREATLSAGGSLRLAVGAFGWAHRPGVGDSIAVNGCCLTVTDPPGADNTLAFDAIPQTLRITTLGSLKPGDRVNLEHAATPTTLLGGHLVQGHIDGRGEVTSVTHTGADVLISVRTPPEIAPFMMPKGSVCIDGVSLTLAEVADGGRQITVALIPATLQLTTLKELKPGQAVNLEADATVKAVVTAVQRIMEKRG